MIKQLHLDYPLNFSLQLIVSNPLSFYTFPHMVDRLVILLLISKGNINKTK